MFASVARSGSQNKTSAGRRNQKLVTHLAPLGFPDSLRFRHGGCPDLGLGRFQSADRTSVCPAALLSIAFGFVLGIPMWILTRFHSYLTPGLASCTRLHILCSLSCLGLSAAWAISCLALLPCRIPIVFPTFEIFTMLFPTVLLLWLLSLYVSVTLQASSQTFKAESSAHRPTVKMSKCLRSRCLVHLDTFPGSEATSAQAETHQP